MSSELLKALSTLITVTLAFLLIYRLWQQYMIDVTRHQLFELRDEVFDLATVGKLRRDSEAYQIVREMFNSSIRFAHKMNPVHVLSMIIIFRIRKKERLGIYAEKVKTTINSLDDEDTKDRLWYILGQMHLILAWHLIRVSPVALVLVILGTLVTLSLRAVQEMRNKFGEFLNGIAYSDAIQHYHSPQS